MTTSTKNQSIVRRFPWPDDHTCTDPVDEESSKDKKNVRTTKSNNGLNNTDKKTVGGSGKHCIDKAVEDVQKDGYVSSSSSLTVSAPAIPITRLRQTTSGGSSRAPAPPVLRRGRYSHAIHPGAVSIGPTSGALGSSEGDAAATNSPEEPGRSEPNNSILVNAELVASDEQEAVDMEEQRRHDTGVLPLALSTRSHQQATIPPLVAAQLVLDKRSSHQSNEPPRLKDFFRNKMVQVVGLLLCLIISGLIVGVVIGFDSNSNNSPTDLEAAVGVPSFESEAATSAPDPSAPVYADMQPTRPAAAPTRSPNYNVFVAGSQPTNSIASETESGGGEDDDDDDDDHDDDSTEDENHD